MSESENKQYKNKISLAHSIREVGPVVFVLLKGQECGGQSQEVGQQQPNKTLVFSM